MSGFLDFSISDNQKEFNKTFNEYLKWQKKQPAEIINAKLYFIALQAMRNTKAATKDEVKNNLEEPSRKYPKVPLVAVLINSELKKKGQKGLSGPKMANAITRYIRRKQTHIQFLRSGWLPAVKLLDFWNKRGDITFVRRKSPKKPEGIKQYGKDKGSAIYAKMDRERTYGIISNAVGQGNQATETVHPLILAGLIRGIQEETRSMRKYIEDKYKLAFDRFKRTGRI